MTKYIGSCALVTRLKSRGASFWTIDENVENYFSGHIDRANITRVPHIQKTLSPISIANRYLKGGVKKKHEILTTFRIQFLYHLLEILRQLSQWPREGSFLESQTLMLLANHYKVAFKWFITPSSRHHFREHVSMAAVVSTLVCKLRAFTRRACKNSNMVREVQTVSEELGSQLTQLYGPYRTGVRDVRNSTGRRTPGVPFGRSTFGPS